MSGGCPVCGGTRLKRAPIPLVTFVVGALTGRHRYRCSACRRVSWHHRLRRRSSSADSLLQPRTMPDRRSAWFFALFAALIVVAAIALVSSCQSEEGIRDSGLGVSAGWGLVNRDQGFVLG